MWIDLFLDYITAERGLAQNTRMSYGQDLEDFMAYWGGSSINDLTVQVIRNYIEHLCDRNLSPSTRRRKMATLRHFFAFLLEENHISFDPTHGIELPKLPRNLPRTLREDDVLKIIKTIHHLPHPDCIRVSCLIELLYGSGLRVTELVSLPLKTIMPLLQESCHLSITLKGKGGKHRMVPITGISLSSLKAYMEVRKHYIKDPSRDNPWLFPSWGESGHLTRQRLFQILKDLALQSGLDPAQVSPHVLRHAFATHLLHRGADILSLQKLLGHKDIRTTEIYTHLEISHLAEALQLYHPLGYGFKPDQESSPIHLSTFLEKKLSGVQND